MSTAPAAGPSRSGGLAVFLGRLTPRQSLAAGALVLIGTVAAYVFMAQRGDDTQGLLLLALPVIAALFQQGGLGVATADQSATLVAEVQALASHPDLQLAIRQGIHHVLDEREELRAQAATVVPAQREPAA